MTNEFLKTARELCGVFWADVREASLIFVKATKETIRDSWLIAKTLILPFASVGCGTLAVDATFENNKTQAAIFAGIGIITGVATVLHRRQIIANGREFFKNTLT